jgi:hypothetical protein
MTTAQFVPEKLAPRLSNMQASRLPTYLHHTLQRIHRTAR